MIFNVQSSLSYVINSPTTIFASVRCFEDQHQKVLHEKLSTNIPINRNDLHLGQSHITRIDVEATGLLDIQYQAKVRSTLQLVSKNKFNQDCDGFCEVHGDELPYLLPSRFAQSDRLRPFAQDMFGDIEGQLNQVLSIEEWIWRKIFYTTDYTSKISCAITTMESRQGVCRDFAHLGIALCRALSIPARYITVYAHQIEHPDFHAAFEVLINGKWILIDPTRIAPLNGFVKIAIGRDAADVAVTTLFGNVYGIGMSVAINPREAPEENFSPMHRQELNELDQVIVSD